MKEQITLGQYFPGASPVHRLDPRIKIHLTLVFIVAIFFVETFAAYGLAFLGILGLVFLSGIPFSRVLKGLKPIFLVLVLTFFVNVLMTPGTLLFQIGFLKVTAEGIEKAIFIGIRLVLLVLGTTLLTLTTSPMQLTDGLESLMKPLTLLHFPSQILAMMVSIALRFIPTLYEEADKIMRAQKARGADFDSGNMLSRAKAMIPLLVPLFINALNRAEELGVAMEARCYNGSVQRTRLNPLKMGPKDLAIGLGGTACLVALAYFL